MGRTNKFQGRSFEFSEDARGFYYLRMAEGEDLLEEDVVDLNDWIQANCLGARKPLLFELAYGTTLSPGVQAYFSENRDRFSTADAILISTFAHKLMATFYLRYYKPQLPTRVFNDVFEALDWIEKQNAEGQSV